MIFSLRCVRWSGQLTERVANRSSSWTQREAVVIAVSAEGHTGVGVAAPLPSFSPDEIQDADRWLQLHSSISLSDFDADLHPLDQLLSWASQLPPGGPPSAVFAVESALLDWLAQRQPGLAHGARRGFDELTLSHLLNVEKPEDWVNCATALLKTRARVDSVKCKIGRTPNFLDRELAAVRSLRAFLGPSIELRLDANGAFALSDAPEILRSFASCGASSIEDPCGPKELLALGPCALPWLVDEGLADSSMAESILSAPGCGGLSVKPALVGGLSRALDLISKASGQGLRAAISHIFDGPIALLALRRFALLTTHELLPSALAYSPVLESWPTTSKRADRENAWIFSDISQFRQRADEWGFFSS